MNSNLMFNNLSGQKVMILPGTDFLEQYKVRGIEGAKNFQTQPSTRIPLFDQDEDYMYIVSTDANGYKTDITRFKFKIEPVPKPEEIFASKEDLNNLKGDIADVKQLIQQFIASTNTGSTEPKQYSKSNAGSASSTNGLPDKVHGTNG